VLGRAGPDDTRQAVQRAGHTGQCSAGTAAPWHSNAERRPHRQCSAGTAAPWHSSSPAPHQACVGICLPPAGTALEPRQALTWAVLHWSCPQGWSSSGTLGLSCQRTTCLGEHGRPVARDCYNAPLTLSGTPADHMAVAATSVTYRCGSPQLLGYKHRFNIRHTHVCHPS
jgi:hypothetical protein